MSETLWNPYQNKVPIPLIWKDQKYAYDGSGNLIYFGKSVVHNPSTSSGKYWWIFKYTYDGSGNLTDMEGPKLDNWDDRTSLNWK